MSFRWPVLLLVPLWLFRAGGAAYFLDTTQGNDAAEGSMARPFRTIARANTLTLQPGDELRFRAGQMFEGTLKLDERDAGTSNAPIVIGSFGGGRARIAAGTGSGILVRNVGGIVISDLELSGLSANRNIGSGVRFENSQTNRLAFVRVRNVVCHDFGGMPLITLNPAGKSYHYDYGEGIAVCAIHPVRRSDPMGRDPLPPVRGFADVVIEDCEVFNCQGCGIHFDGPDPATETAYAHADVRVAHCAAHDNQGDGDFFNNHSGSGIFVSSVERGLIEQCRAWNNGRECKAYTGGPCGIWAANSTRIVIQRCESFHNLTGQLDGAGFDLDGGVTDSVIQQCYSHENDGAGFLLYSYPDAPLRFAGNVCRFNISLGDSRRGRYGGICVGAHGGRWQGVDIYHNTVVTDPTNAAGAALFLVTPARPEGIRVWNNIFLARGEVPLVRSAALPGLQIVGNAWWSLDDSPRFIHGTEVFTNLSGWRAASGLERLGGHDTGFADNPGLVLPTEMPAVIDTMSLAPLQSLRLAPGSPLRHAPLDPGTRLAVPPPGARDFFDQALNSEGPWLPGADAVPAAPSTGLRGSP